MLCAISLFNFFRLSACGYGTLKRQNRGNKEKNATRKNEKTKYAWRKDEIVNYAARTDVNHENKREKTKKRHAKKTPFKTIIFVSFVRLLFVWCYFVFSLFRVAFLVISCVFSRGNIIESFRHEKTK